MLVVCSLDRDGFEKEQRGHEMFGECTCKSVLLLNTVASISRCPATFASGCALSGSRRIRGGTPRTLIF